MKVFYGIENLPDFFKKSVIAIGNFDGVHLGHQKIFKEVYSESKKISGESVVITFYKHTLYFFKPQNPPLIITPLNKKIELISKNNIENLILINFTEKFANLSAEKFVKEILCKKLNVKYIVIGYDFKFGYGGKGNATTLNEIGRECNFNVNIVEPLKIDDEIISSSAIRRYISQGELEKVSKMLGRRYSIDGIVVKGAGRGKKIGFPTANIKSEEKVFLKNGVYSVFVYIGKEKYLGALSCGTNPTFQTSGNKVIEVHLINFDKEIYGSEITVEFIERLRDEIHFDNVSSLIKQIEKDIELIKNKNYEDK